MLARKTRNGFTLIELLTVIAIIAILAALLFPTFSHVAEQRRQAQCMQQMHDINVALKQYFDDNNKYPAALLGLAQDSTQNFYNGSGTTVPLSQITYKPLLKATGSSGQKYLQDTGLFHCPDESSNDPAAITTATYPANNVVPLSGQQAVFTGTIAHIAGNNAQQGQPMYFYAFDSYDVGPQVDKDGNVVSVNGKPNMELHYSLDWTNDGGSQDNPNQLKYPTTLRDDHTVVTWCTYHVATAHANVIPVLMLSGTVKAVPVDRFVQLGPLNFSF